MSAAWGAVIVLLAAVFHVHGARGLLLAAIPLVVTLGAGALLRFGVGASTIGGLGMARLLAIALLVGSVAGTVTYLIGIFVIPTAVGLVVAAFQCRSLGVSPISLRRRPQPSASGH
jgi:hypothetical protein